MRDIQRIATTATWAVLALIAGGCSEGAPKVKRAAAAEEAGPVAHPAGEWSLAGGAKLALAERALALRGPAGAARIAGNVVGRPAVSADGARFVFVRESERELRTEVLAVELRDGAWSAPRSLADEGTPDLVSISPDGRLVAFVAGAGGIAAVWVVPFDGGPPVRLTNAGLRREGAGPPPGFVPVPLRDPPRFEGEQLVWTSRQGEHRAVLP
jgi:hypothetical protein